MLREALAKVSPVHSVKATNLLTFAWLVQNTNLQQELELLHSSRMTRPATDVAHGSIEPSSHSEVHNLRRITTPHISVAVKIGQIRTRAQEYERRAQQCQKGDAVA